MGQQAAALVGTGGRPRSFSRPQLALPGFRQAHSVASTGPRPFIWIREPGKRSTGHALYFVTIKNIEGWPSRQGVNGTPEMGFGLFAALAAIGPAMERTASMSGGGDGDRPANSGRLSGSMPRACHCRASAASRHGSEARSFIAPERNCWQCPLFGAGAYVPWQSRFSQYLTQMSAGAVLLEVAKDERREQICTCRLQGPVAPGFELWDFP